MIHQMDDAPDQVVNKQHWIDVCATETLLPFSGWNQMVASISSQLASQIKPYLSKPEFRQMVLQLLGNEFATKYLNDLPNQPMILQPSYMSATTFQLLQTDATQWLNRQITIACKQLGIPFHIGSVDVSSSFDLQQFFDHVRSTVEENIVKECLLKSQQKLFDAEWWKSDAGLECQSEVIGDGLLQICLSSPISFVARQSQFIGRRLPKKLRSWAWRFLLELFHYNHQVGQKSLHKLDLASRHDNLSQMFKQKIEILRTTRAVGDSIDELICKTTKQMFHTVPALVEAANKTSLPTYCSTVLSHLHRYGYKFHYTNVLLVMPLVTTLELSSASDPVPLVTYLSVFMDNCLPSVDHMKNIAHRVSTYLSNSETHLCTHINELLCTGGIILLAELSLSTGGKLPMATIESFIHKWISTCFVEILSLETLLFAWDQLFLSNWSYSMIKDLCIGIMKILKTSVLECSSATSLKKVLLSSTQLIGSGELSKMIRS